MPGWAVFDTAIGCCGIAWGEHGIVGSQLPERDREATRRRMKRRFPQADEAVPPPEVADAIGRLQALLRGEQGARVDLASVRLDMSGLSEFNRRVYMLARQLQPGQTTSYGEFARRLGDADAARAVGRALGQNPFAPIVPCHRVLAASGAGGFSAPGGAQTKLRMLAIEGAAPNGQPMLF